jgi:hypothetical protein
VHEVGRMEMKCGGMFGLWINWQREGVVKCEGSVVRGRRLDGIDM